MNIDRAKSADRTRIAIEHAVEEVTVTAKEVEVGDFLVRIPQHDTVASPRARRVTRIRGTRFESQVTGNALVYDGRGGAFIGIEVASHRGTVFPVDGNVPVTVRRATRLEMI